MAGAVRRDFWGLLVSKVVRGLKVPMGWAEGKDWALATRLGGESFCGGWNEELGCREKETEGGLAEGVFGAACTEAGGGCHDLWTRAGQGIRPNWGGAMSKDFQMELKPNHCPAQETSPHCSQESRPNKSSLRPLCLLLERQRKQSPWGVLVLGISLWIIDSQTPERPPGRSPAFAAGLLGESGSGVVALMAPPPKGPCRWKQLC